MDQWDQRMTRAPEQLPRLELIETCWRFKNPSNGRVIFCAIYRTGAGPELRAGYSVDNVVRTETVRSLNTARGLAAGWRHALIGAGFIELPREA
jgi:hypothetical protein